MSDGTSASRRQKRMGPAPFASFEDLSDELESPDDKSTVVVRLPGIREDVTPTNTPIPMDPKEYGGISLVGAVASPAVTSKLQAPTGTPRIDISRASSSSHHDSKDSSPDRELFEAHDPTSAKLGLGFREEGALDLRSSTEELDFQDPQDVAANKKKGKPRAQSPSSELHQHQRKDSSTSEIGLLSISGRTSRLSSIGSQGSAQSRLSNASHLSVLSGQSGLSRSPSPHKMLLETSFCGTKHPAKSGQAPAQGTKVESTETLEKVLLSRKHDPTEAVLAEGIEQPRKEPAVAPAKPTRKVNSDITIKVDEPQAAISNKIPKKIISKSGVEYIYIPLKGPLPIDDENPPREVRSASHAVIRTKEAVSSRGAKSATPSPQKREEEPKYIRIRLKPDYMYSQEDDSSKPKPDTLDLSEQQQPSTSYASIELKASPKLPRQSLIKEVGSKTPSPSLSRKSSFASLFRSKETIISPESPTVPGACRRKNTISGILRDAGDKVRERSRSRSKSRERDKEKSLSAAPSSTESIDSKTKQKSMFSIFKSSSTKKVTGGGGSEKKSEEPLEALKLEFKFNDSKHESPLQCDSIRIPLHSPTHYDGVEQNFEEDLVAQGLVAQTSRQLSSREQSLAAEKQHEQNLIEQSLVEQAIQQSLEQSIEQSIIQDVMEESILQNVKTSSQDSQDTVIEAPIHRVQAIVEAEPKSNRQSSTSSENVVFSTKLGSEGGNEVFTTKLPKGKGDYAKNGAVPKDRSAVTNGEIEEVIHMPRTTSSLSNLDVKEPEMLITSVTSIDDGNSSESERGSELDFSKNKKEDLKLDLDYLEPERKNLVLQDSYEDELPYVPTTLPQEQSAIVPIVPIKQRSTFEMKTIPIERPRSTTPINPSCLEEYCEEVMGAFNNSKAVTETIEKLKISLPRHDSIKSPRKPAGNTTNWFEFAEKGLRRSSQDDIPPPLPPKGVQKEWINFEEIPERRKPPKKIQTLPSRGHIEVPESVLQDNVVYNYVNPEECKCECHEITASRGNKEKAKGIEPAAAAPAPAEDELPLLVDEEAEEDKPKTLLGVAASDRRSVISDSSVDLSLSVEPPPETTGGVALRTPFTSDLGVSSNRSSIVSQDEPHSPDSGSPNAFPKTF